MSPRGHGPERARLDEDARRDRNWRRFGPYLAERQWGTVREDYSAGGEVWSYISHDHARSRAYRWGEDGLLGITDRECRLCFAFALWNGADPILKERLFGLTGPEGNHGEDVKELYYFLDATPTFSYARALYKYPQAAYPYAALVDENRRRSAQDPEFELEDSGVFEDDRYFDIFVEYAKADPEDILIRLRCVNRGPDAAALHVLPTLWQRNTWSWGRSNEGYWPRGRIEATRGGWLAEHPSLGRYRLAFDAADGSEPRFLFTENETNAERLYGAPSATPYVKDAFHRCVVDGDEAAVNPDRYGTKAAAWYALAIPAGGEVVIRARFTSDEHPDSGPFDAAFDELVRQRRAEADEFYATYRGAPLDEDERNVARQADAGLIWSRQFYHLIVDHWLDGDPTQPPPPATRRQGRNREWRHLWARDVLSMPDTWEYPW
ncbi:MAG: glucosidase, partial [Myxococcales bacterium]|nr:glucosidase [Myxococcales bacterium]